MVLSTLDLKPTDVVWDIGCGSGSVSVEAGLSVYEGWLCAVDVKEEAVKLTEKNLIKAKIANYELTVNSAPNGLDDFKTPDAVFIGGSNGNIDDIIECARKRKPDVKIVMTAISLDTLSSALALPIEWDIIQVQSSLSRKIGKHHMMSAENPIYILSFGGNNE
jgi:precorrin-6Y C5,15-methyltransferase (decarboxylating)